MIIRLISKSRYNAWYDMVLDLEKQKKDHWNIKHKKGNSSKIWRYLQSEVKFIAKHRLLGSNKYLFEIDFLKDRALVRTHRTNSTKYVTVSFKNPAEVDKIVQDLSPVLAHYKLKLEKVKECETNHKVTCSFLPEQWAVTMIEETEEA